MVSLALRTWIRYAIPLTALAAIVFVPAIVLALRVDVPVDAAGAKPVAVVGFGLGAIAWVFQLVVVGAVAPAVRSHVDDQPASQWSVFTRGLRGALAGLAPVAVVTMAVVVGGIALVVPGVVVLGLLAPAAASRQLGTAMPAPLVDTLEVMRPHLGVAIGLALAILAVDVGLAVVLRFIVAMPIAGKNPPAVALEHLRLWVRATVATLVVISPLVATHVVAVYETKRRS